MAESNITKQALANALRELMSELPFDKINVAQICTCCGMSRKSFYYHFRDKYDLVNWIFDTEFITFIRGERLGHDYGGHWKLVERACVYFYQNRDFYRKALQIYGQNSFRDHFREYIRPLFFARLSHLLDAGEIDAFSLDVLTNAAICSMERWLQGPECMPPDQFTAKIQSLIEKCAVSICREMAQNRDLER